jgi:hypothetical protein
VEKEEEGKKIKRESQVRLEQVWRAKDIGS